MIPAVTFDDAAEGGQVDYLKDAFAARPEAYAASTVSTEFPAATLVNATHVQVELEASNAADYPVTERAQARFTCHAPPTRRAGHTVGGRSDVKKLASLTMALVATQGGAAGAAGAFIRGGRSDVSVDPDTKNLMCWFIAEVPLLATPLAP